MNISHVSAHYRPIIGGQEVYISNLIEVCRKHGHQSTVIQVNRGEQSDDNICVPRLRYLARFFPSLDRKWLNYMISLFWPTALSNADVIIAHYAFHAKPLKKIAAKTIVLSHGVEWRVTNQTKEDVAVEKNARWCLGRFLHVINDTHYLRCLGHEVPSATGFFSEVIPGVWFIPNCVDTEHFRPGIGLSEFDGKKMILVPRQMVEARGIHLAIAAFALIAEDFPQLEMCLLGKRHKAASPYIARLDQMIADAGLQDRIYFRDPVPNKDMPTWFNAAKVVLVPTLEKEGTSLSAIESMSCGVATVSTNVAGLADLPTVQCDPDAGAMAEALRDTLNNAERIGAEQRKIVQATFNMENWSKGWMKAISSITS